MTVNMSSVIDVVETTEDISSMTQIIPSIDNFGYNSLQELSAGVADSLKLNSFTSNGVLGTSQTDWVQIAKDVVASVKDNGTFSVIHNHKGQRYVYGYIYADKLYGTVNIQMYEGYTKTVDVNNGVYTLRG